jgi:hypothetical protein
MNLLKEKVFPDNYPDEAVKILKTMTLTTDGLKIMGSASLKSQLYAGDYDGYEVVDGLSPSEISNKLRSVIQNLKKLPHTYIGDFKSGLIEDWRVLPKDTKTLKKHIPKVELLLKSNIISKDEAEVALEFLNKPPTKINILKALDEIKFHIVRWTPAEIIAGKKTLRDGTSYTLEEAVQSPTITKLDVISLVKGRYTEFSVIYEFHYKGKYLNPETIDPEKSLKESILLYKAEGNRFKVIKRKFALAKLHNNVKDLKKYHSLLNSELGKLYVVYSDVKTLADLLGHSTLSPIEKVRATDGLKRRITTIYKFEDFIKGKKSLLKDLEDATAPRTSNAKTISVLRHIEEQLLTYLTRNTRLQGGFVYHPHP